MRVLWFACAPGLYSETTYCVWIASLEKILLNYCPNMELAICFEGESSEFKEVKDGVTYYPVSKEGCIKDKILWRLDPKNIYKVLKPQYMKVLDDFKPDLVHCFGTEMWHYGLLASEINIPFVIHIMGFQSIYSAISKMVVHKADKANYFHYNPIKILQYRFRDKKDKENDDIEREIMHRNHFFMGRTNWDKSIVKYFSNGGKYYYCPEAIREEIYSSPHQWKYHESDTIKLVTIGSGSGLKGNEIMLYTANILKNVFRKKVEWRFTSDVQGIKLYEHITRIRHEQVGIRLIGKIGVEDIIKELCQAEIYVHPTIIDNSPNSLCEAQLIGTPVIATNVGGIPQMVEDGKTGILYPYNEAYTLAFKIMDLHGNRQWLEELSENEIVMSHQRHAPKQLAEKIEEIYSDMLVVYKAHQWKQ